MSKQDVCTTLSINGAQVSCLSSRANHWIKIVLDSQYVSDCTVSSVVVGRSNPRDLNSELVLLQVFEKSIAITTPIPVLKQDA